MGLRDEHNSVAKAQKHRKNWNYRRDFVLGSLESKARSIKKDLYKGRSVLIKKIYFECIFNSCIIVYSEKVKVILHRFV